MDVAISVDYIESPTEEEPEGEIRFICKVWYAQGQYISFAAYADYSDSVSVMRENIKDAAVTAAALESITIGILDKKTLVGGPVGLL